MITKFRLIVYECTSTIISTSTIVPNIDSTMVTSKDTRTSGGYGFQRLIGGVIPAERHFFALNDAHWTNSFWLWMVLNSIDLAITWQILSLGGYEVNPFLNLVAQTYDYGGMFAAKMALAVLIGLLVWRRGTRRMKSILNFGINLVIITNCALLFRAIWL